MFPERPSSPVHKPVTKALGGLFQEGTKEWQPLMSAALTGIFPYVAWELMTGVCVYIASKLREEGNAP